MLVVMLCGRCAIIGRLGFSLGWTRRSIATRLPSPARSLFILLLGFSSIMAAPIQVHGHRGARAMRPENTVPAFEYAIDAGVDALDMDLAVTKDDVLVVSHEPVLNSEICRSLGGS